MAHFSEANLHNAIDQYAKATRLDPRYALAWSELSRTWRLLSGSYLGGTAAQEANAKARSAVDQALTLAPDLANAHLAQSVVRSRVDFDQRAAEAELRRALQLAPGDANVKSELGALLFNLGDTQ